MTKLRHIRTKPKASEVRGQLTCKSTDCYDFPHRMGGGRCKFTTTGAYKDGPVDIQIPEPEGFPF